VRLNERSRDVLLAGLVLLRDLLRSGGTLPPEIHDLLTDAGRHPVPSEQQIEKWARHPLSMAAGMEQKGEDPEVRDLAL